MDLTNEQIREGFLACVDLPARDADVQVVNMLGATTENLAEYIWDHWMGEPSEVTQEQVLEHLQSLFGETSSGGTGAEPGHPEEVQR